MVPRQRPQPGPLEAEIAPSIAIDRAKEDERDGDEDNQLADQYDEELRARMKDPVERNERFRELRAPDQIQGNREQAGKDQPYLRRASPCPEREGPRPQRRDPRKNGKRNPKNNQLSNRVASPEVVVLPENGKACTVNHEAQEHPGVPENEPQRFHPGRRHRTKHLWAGTRMAIEK